MNSILIVTLIGSVIISLIYLKKIINPISIMNFIWILILRLYNLFLFGLIPANENAISIIYVGLLAYNVGFWVIYFYQELYTIGKNNFSAPKLVSYEYEVEVRENLIQFLGVISIVFLAIPALQSLKILVSGGSLATIRQLNQSLTGAYNLSNSNKFLGAINLLIVQPFITVLPSVAFAHYWKRKKIDRVLKITIVILLLSLLGSAGRGLFTQGAFAFVICYLIIGKKKGGKNRLGRKSKIYLILGGIVMLTIIIGATISRNQGDFWKINYLYFSMEPYMLDYWVQASNGVVGHGMTSLNGFIFPFFYVLKNALGVGFPENFQQVFNLIQNTGTVWIPISTGGREANAYVSVFWSMFVDGGMLGVVIGMFAYGGALANTFCLALKNQTERSVAIYAFLLYGVALSFVRFSFITSSNAIGLIILVFIIYRKNKKGNIN